MGFLSGLVNSVVNPIGWAKDQASGLSSSSAPDTPDYIGAAKATAQGNLDLAKYTTAANRVNQNTPWGNLSYTQTTDAQGNPVWTATQNLSADQQSILDQNSALSKSLLGAANGAAGSVDASGVNLSSLPSMGFNPGQTYQDAMMERLQPQIDRENQASDAQLANQGITQGSTAYNNAKTLLNQQHNDLLAQATTQGFNTGLAANNQSFNQQAQNKQMPVNIINALRTGSQTQAPNYVTPYNQQQVNGVDYTGAAQNTYGANLNATNAANASKSNFMNGLMSAGTTAAMMLSDRRLKTHIKKIGEANGLNVYEWIYLWGKKAIGYMADEVEKIRPDAVATHASGFKMVNYGVL